MFAFYIINGDLFLNIQSEKLAFNAEFHNDICKLLKIAERLKNNNIIRITMKNCIIAPKICKSILSIVIRFIVNKGVKVYGNRDFHDDIKQNFGNKSLKNYKNRNFMDLVLSDDIPIYVVKVTDDATKLIENIADLAMTTGFALNEHKVRLFLTATIGEILANCENHSFKDEANIAFDISVEGDDQYLYVSIIDNGATIVENVRRYLKDTKKPSVECLKWASKMGNSTRNGSGGYGLTQITDYIKAVNGSLYLYSGEANMVREKNTDFIISSFEDKVFNGTIVSFKIKLWNTENVVYVEDKEIKSISLVDI